MEKIEINKILEGIPCGVKLYSPLYGEIIFKYVDDYGKITCKCGRMPLLTFNRYGKLYLNLANENLSQECLLFPSEENRDWNSFQMDQYTRERNIYSEYVWLGESFEVHVTKDYDEDEDRMRYERGNYFPMCLRSTLDKLALIYYKEKEKQKNGESGNI